MCRVFKKNRRFSKVYSLCTNRYHHTKLFVEVQADTNIYTRAEEIVYGQSLLLYVEIYVTPCVYRFLQYMYGKNMNIYLITIPKPTKLSPQFPYLIRIICRYRKLEN